MLKDKFIILGVTGSIAAYKAAALASALVKLHAQVQVIMTKNAQNFIHPVTFETLTGRKCLTDTFDRNFSFEVEHIAVAKRADAALVAPASANVVGKLAHGIADDMLTTTLLACTCKKFLSPAMNTAMYENPAVQDNLRTLRTYGYEIIEPASGRLACGDTGAGKMPEPDELLSYLVKELAYEKDLSGRKVLVTAGPTQEAIDPVRVITNHSTGKMGYAIARAAMLRGAQVTLVSGPVNLMPPPFVKVVPVRSAEDMFQAVASVFREQDAVIKAAAVADYTPAAVSAEKVKKKDGDMSIPLKRTRDILKYLGEHRRDGQFLCGFSMETENMLRNSQEKLARKNVDMIVANNLKVAGAGFGTDTNVVTLITRDGVRELPMMSKDEVAHAVLDRIFAV
ncbi:MAG: bifunctional phosphopantothenoylcysteine decarboxylase/phosphopantothenate--cysteine ligase CoaBC [Lachnospiraceae bacterium]